MVAKGSPDWLPSGWTVDYKVQKTGRKIRLYTNVENGKSFYYKDDVISYIKSTQSQKSQPTSSRIKTQSEISPVQPTVTTNEHPEWLPAGWKVESKTRLTGSNAGGVYKCYVDPTTDSRFYSKPEVFRYLRTVKNKVCTLKERKTSKDTNTKRQVVIEHYNDEDLPPGWIKEIKIKHKADGLRKDPFYIDPKSGYIFRSKRDVLRYLETGEISKNAVKPKEGGDNHRVLVNEKASLPTTTKGQKPKLDAATPQPLAGEETPQSGSELRDASVSPIETVQDIASSQEGVKEIKEKSHKRSSQEGVKEIKEKSHKRSSQEGVKEIKEKSHKRSSQEGVKEIKEKSHKTRSASRRADPPEGKVTEGVSSDDAPVSTSAASESDQVKALPKSEKLETNKIDVATPVNTPLSTTESKLEQEKTAIFDTMERGDDEEKMETKQDDSGQETNTKAKRFTKKKDINLPRRSSKRLAGLDSELVSKAEANEVLQASSNINSFAEVIPDAGLTVNTYADKEGQQLNVTGPERENKDHVANFVDVPLHENSSSKRKTPLECGLDVPEEKVQKVQTEKKDDGKTEAQLSVPIAEFWSDPCLEFAIKTLTGAFPVENATTTTTDEPVLNPTFDFLQGQNSVNNGPGSTNKRTQGSKQIKNKKQPTSNRRSPSINRQKSELASNIISFQQSKHHSNEGVLGFHLVENEQCKTPCQIMPQRELHHPLPEVNSERLNMTNTCHESNKMVLDDQPQNLQTDHMTSETPMSFPFGDSWADPCLDFAFKTLTGAIPIEDNLDIQSFFEERIDSSRSQKDSSLALPDFGSPNFFQNDISSHFDGPERSVSGQHLSLDPQLSLGNTSLPSCSGFTSQQVDRNRYFKGR